LSADRKRLECREMRHFSAVGEADDGNVAASIRGSPESSRSAAYASATPIAR